MSAGVSFTSDSAPTANGPVPASKPGSTPVNHQIQGTLHVDEVLQKYKQERDKRVRPDGSSQYINPAKSEKLKRFQEDPWIDAHTPNPGLVNFPTGSRVKVLVVGAGFGGLLFGARFQEAGINDICIVDSAGGFGGTWYWNRYPGLMCDVESYVYMPLLEETGYMPKHKYSSGYELREHANRIAERYQLFDKALFQVKIREMVWDDVEKEWNVNLKQINGGPDIVIKAQFVISSTGILNYPKLPGIPGIEDFQGHMFHTSRWDYDYTGGSPSDPSLTKLQDKKVGIIGTGATAVQVVPHLGRWSKELFVFQRTPSAVDVRDNRPTDPEWWAQEVISSGQGWQRRRMENFNEFISNITPPPPVDLVSDNWTKMHTFSVVTGGPKVAFDSIGAYLADMQALDFPRQERIRRRVDETVRNKDTAEKLKPWYAGWCKRPCFHDEYLPTFNRPNVHLVDTDGRGIDSITTRGLVVGGKEYDLDVVIFGTGFYTPAKDSPATRADMVVRGREGKTLDDKWKKGVSTLHGIITRGFPNLFFTGPHQAGASANQVYSLDQFAIHLAYLLSKATQDHEARKGKTAIEPTADAEEAWSMEVVSRAGVFAAFSGCTPSYLNLEGETDKPATPEEQMTAARGALWGEGPNNFVKILQAWRSEGKLRGLEVTA